MRRWLAGRWRTALNCRRRNQLHAWTESAPARVGVGLPVTHSYAGK